MKQLFDAAAQRAPNERARFLAQACAGDDDLRREVEALLSSFEDAASFMEKPAVGEIAEMFAREKGELASGARIAHYEVIKPLGAGGMGEVYLARDTTLNRKVALKFLSAQFTSSSERLARFNREAETTSALNHPNILTVYEINSFDDVRFIAAEFVDGETLRERLRRGDLTIEEALEIAVQTASALAAAHEAGIIHRDIKPENIMIRRDRLVKVLDFGLAKLAETNRPEIDFETEARAQVETTPGMILGTVAYMSPEQARGKETDARTDIWSLGAVIYEMIAGQKPFAGETTSDILAAILRTEPQLLKRLAPAAPDELRRIVNKCLRHEREARYQTAKDLLVDLESLKNELQFAAKIERRSASQTSEAKPKKETDGAPDKNTSADTQAANARRVSSAEYVVGEIKHHTGAAIAALLIVLIGLAAGVYLFRASLPRERAAGDVTKIESLAVLPFENAAHEADAEYLSDGVTESLINSLSQLPNLRVVSRSTVFNFKGKPESPQQIGQSLNVRAVLTGKITPQKDSLIVQADLVDVANNTELWGNRFNVKMADLMQVEEQIAAQIVSKLQLRLSSQQKAQISKQYTQNPEAYREYLKGRYYTLNYTPEGHKQALEHLNKAIEIDPTYALAYAGIADAYTTVSDWMLPPREALTKAKAAAQKALELDDQLAEAYAARGHARLHEWDRSAIDDLNRAIALAPNVMTNYLWLGEYYMIFDPAQAIPILQKASELDPLSPLPSAFLVTIYMELRQFDAAIKSARKTEELVRDDSWGAAYYFGAYTMRGDYQSAMDILNRVPPDNTTPDVMGAKAYVFARQGRRSETERIIAELQKQSQQSYVSPMIFAEIYAALGDRDKTFYWLDRAYEDRSEFLGFIRNDFKFDSIRDDARYKELIHRIGFAD